MANVPRTALQRHAAFFDPDGTGKVTLRQTWDGLGNVGVQIRWRLLLAPIINGFLGYLTQKKIRFTILVPKIEDGKHPFDSGTFADDGEIDENALAALVAAGGFGPLALEEMRALVLARGNRRAQMGKLAGSLGSWFSRQEVRLFFCVAADTTKEVDGKEVPAVTERTLRRFYDGSLLHTLARVRRGKRVALVELG